MSLCLKLICLTLISWSSQIRDDPSQQIDKADHDHCIQLDQERIATEYPVTFDYPQPLLYQLVADIKTFQSASDAPCVLNHKPFPSKRPKSCLIRFTQSSDFKRWLFMTYEVKIDDNRPALKKQYNAS